MSVGNRVFTKEHCQIQKWLKHSVKIAAANVADCMGRLCGMKPQIKLMSNPSGLELCVVLH